MDNQVICPKCGNIIKNAPLTALAETGEGETAQFITCECGEKITFWAITAQLREQKKFSAKFRTWLKTIFKRQG